MQLWIRDWRRWINSATPWFYTLSYNLLQTERRRVPSDDGDGINSSNDEEMNLQSQVEVEYGRENFDDFWSVFVRMIRAEMIRRVKMNIYGGLSS